jgi:hypothetical protein
MITSSECSYGQWTPRMQKPRSGGISLARRDQHTMIVVASEPSGLSCLYLPGLRAVLRHLHVLPELDVRLAILRRWADSGGTGDCL